MSFNLTEHLSDRFPEVSAEEFYRELFPVGSFEEKGVFESGKYNGIIVEIGEGRRVFRHTLTDEHDKVREVVSRDNFCLVSPISYIGKSRRSENARDMYALAIDLDGVDDLACFNFLMTQIEHGHEMLCFVWGLPKPTYIVSSGTGLHLYFFFKEPVRLFPNVANELEKLKKRLTWQAWTQGASALHDSVQYESLFQGFRMVGTKTKVGTRARAFKCGGKVDVKYLNGFVPEDYRAENLGYISRLSLAEAKEKYPEWYERRIVRKVPRGTWLCKRDLYDWWIRKLKEGAEQGHRYWCVMVLAVYARKSGIDYDELARDAFGLVDFLDSRGDGTDPFTESDVLDALEAYNDRYMTYPIDAIAARTGIPIQKNRRNGRKQKQHMAVMRAIQSVTDPEGTWRYKPPTKEAEIKAYAAAHPEANHSQIARALGVSRPTVIKWLKN